MKQVEFRVGDHLYIVRWESGSEGKAIDALAEQANERRMSWFVASWLCRQIGYVAGRESKG